MEDLQTQLAGLIDEHGLDAVLSALDGHVKTMDTTTDVPPGSTNPPPPKP